jgi:large subunit ribosomal protein L17
MRHGRKINHLGRTRAHRKALLKNLSISLLVSPKKRIFTTVAKAKALRQYVEPLITRGKDNTTHSRRTAFSYLQNKEAVKELFGQVAAKVGDRPGGYTRILKIGNRQGDNAEMALIELVDFNEFITEKPKKKSSRRRKKTTGGATAKPAADAPKVDIAKAKVEEPKVDLAKAEPVVEEAAVEETTTETPSEEA